MALSSGNTARIVSNFEVFLKEISADHGGEKSLKLAKQALELTNDVPALDFDSREHRTAALKLHTIAINVWNLAVGMKTTGASSIALNAHLRHIACSLVFLTSPPSNSESNRKKQLTMAVKTGRAWLDCDMPSMAETSLVLAKDCWDKLTESPGQVPPSETMKQLFKILCFKAEAAVGLEEEEKALLLVREARDLVNTRLEKEAGYLSMLCYNFGLEAFQKSRYETSTTWLKESYELGQGCADVGAKKQSRTLRLLASAYLEWDCDEYWKKALNAVGLANSECSHPTGFYLKCCILLKHDIHDTRLRSALEETLRHSELTTDLAHATVQLFARYQRVDLSLAALRIIASRFKNSPDVGKFQLLHLEILLQEKHFQEAKDVLEDAIMGHNAGNPLDVSTRKSFHLILWEQASNALDREEYKEAVMWYNYSHSLFTDVDTDCKNLAKLQRNRCHCYIMLEEYDKASVVLTEALLKDGDNPYTQFMAYKLAMAQGDSDKALEAIGNLSGSLSCDDQVGDEEVRGLVCLAAQVAFEKSTPLVAVKTLEQLTNLSTNTQQLLTALRCLTRLRLSFMNKQENQSGKNDHISATVGYIEKALGILTKIKESGSTIVEDEAMWFVKVAWNLALQCSKVVHSMYQLFTLCSQLLELCGNEDAHDQKSHTCLLMASAACLQIARESDSNDEKTQSLKEVLQLISKSRAVKGDKVDRKQTGILLVLYEFEARAMMGMGGLEDLLETLSTIPSVEPKTFEIAATLTVQSRVADKSICEKALKLAIQGYQQQTSLDYTEYSKCYHSLIQLYMEVGGHHDMARMEKAWKVLQEALKAVEGAAKGEYPEVEILWLMTKIWNNGVRYFSGGRYKEAEQWCSLSMQFLQHLTSFRESYQQQMSSVYSEILDKLHSHQPPPAVLV